MKKETRTCPETKTTITLTLIAFVVFIVIPLGLFLYFASLFSKDTCPYHDDYTDSESFAVALNERASSSQREDFVIVVPNKDIVKSELYYIWLLNSYEGCSPCSKQINVTHISEEFSFLPNENGALRMTLESSEDAFEPIGTQLGSYVFNGVSCKFYDNEYVEGFVYECYFSVGAYSYKVYMETEFEKQLSEISSFIGDMICNRKQLADV